MEDDKVLLVKWFYYFLIFVKWFLLNFFIKVKQSPVRHCLAGDYSIRDEQNFLFLAVHIIDAAALLFIFL